jgi:predicted secreted hydrolase
MRRVAGASALTATTKSAEHGNASYYYSITRLQTDGSVSVDGRDVRISGLSWLDREWSTSALAPDQVGWDWFALQLSDGSDFMFYQLRTRDGRQDRMSAGTLVGPGGAATHVRAEQVMIRVEDEWESPAGGAYPSAWTIELLDRNMRLRVSPVIANQELFTTVRYWEGAVDVSGEHDGEPVEGRGYVELTGYAD